MAGRGTLYATSHSHSALLQFGCGGTIRTGRGTLYAAVIVISIYSGLSAEVSAWPRAVLSTPPLNAFPVYCGLNWEVLE